MSYKYTVLHDNPISFYMLDEVQSGTTLSYDALLDQFATYQDLKDNGVSYSALTGLPIYDYSGNLNDGYAFGASSKNIMPIISGGVRGTLVLDTTTITLFAPGIGYDEYADNPFSLEMWVRLPEYSTSQVTLLGDADNNIGLFYQSEDVIFKVQDSSIRYKVSSSKAVHIVATFSSNSISLFIDGALVSTESTNDIRFNNAAFNLKVGPSLLNKNFIIDSIAIYKYQLSSQQVISHYSVGMQEVPYNQIIDPDNGYSFTLNASKVRPSLRYYFPKYKKWSEVASSPAIVSSDQSYITFEKTSSAATASFSYIEEFAIPEYLEITSSQLSYDSDVNNVVVEFSLNSDDWVIAENNAPIPFINKNDGITSGIIYMKITMSSTDTSKDIPILRSLSLDFFSNKDFYSDNSGNRIYSDADYALGRYNYPVLNYNKYNGLRMIDGGGIDVDIVDPIKSVELIFTPVAGACVLFSSNTKIFEWDSSGQINKNGVSSIYINGVDFSSSADINDFFALGTPHHVVLNLSTQATSNIKFNSDGTDSGGANTYNNIALYPDNLSEEKILKHYLLYTDRDIISISESAFSISEANTGNDNTAYIINNQNWVSASI